MSNEEETSLAPVDPGSYGLELIDISLDRADCAFAAGQEITGKIVLELSGPIEALGLRIKCKGEARVHFTDRSVGIRRKFAAEESYLHLNTYIAGDGESRTPIASGSYPFEFRLPEDLPCSFEGLYGRIRYSLRASLIVAPGAVLHSAALPFSLVSICDLNQDSLAPLPISENQSKTFIGQKEPLRIELSLPVRGFVPGQTVPMEISLKNDSNVRVAKIRILLKKVVTYYAREKSRRHKEVVVEIELPVTAKSQLFRENFDVPSLPPSGMRFCGILDVVYALKVEACVDLGEWYYRMLQKNPKIRTRIVVGTVPLRNYEEALAADDGGGGGGFRTGLRAAEAEEQYEKSQIYRSSKPDKDDPTGDEGDSDGEVSPYSPLYRVYTFKQPRRSVGKRDNHL